ncbi:RecQ family ATP-dependent DNA helicase [Rugosimonospora africana]|uniref:ATP-dependent DNA helicase RecQ n=1 Tax=Rugosimonospora africana TaxID=556532 RepID=A0A8J3VMR3_9ACTN|nr:DEAD/DEAH box helicase [Rugosimonospora africana]GIH12504.1 ATP-dependent DNA helicase RecQ [Rugosimonospora africana]
MPTVRDQAEEVLRALAGDQARLRDDQWTAIEALVVGHRRVLCVQRTGWGKSAVYFIATALLRRQHAGPTVIISPLLALMRNQVEAASRAGIRAYTINSANLQEWEEITAAVHDGTVDVLLISPERLNNPDFRDSVLPKLAGTTGLLVVDEAHCVSDWGHDFRPDYRRLRTFLAELAPDTPVLATTATANARVVTDVAEQLSRPVWLGASGAAQGPRPVASATGGETLVLRGSLDRESLRLAVLDLPSPAHRLGWLGDHLAELPGSGIIYTLTVAAARETAEFLRSRGFEVADYTGQSEDADRRAAEADLLGNRVKALVATSALGMGFDKPDLGFVVHLGAPPSPIAYYQQVGRAGRAVHHAEVLLLPGAEDTAIWRYFASLAFPPEDQVRTTLAALTHERAQSTALLETKVELRRARLELMLKVLDVDGAVRRVKGGWVATGEPWSYDAERLARVAAARRDEQQAMLDYVATTECRMDYLRRCLDDPDSVPCGRCDNCAGARYQPAVSEDAVRAATAFLGRAGVEIPPRKLWPTGLPAIGVPLSGKVPAGEQAEAGRAVGRLSDLGWGTRLRAALDSGGQVPGDLVDAAVAILRDWSASWTARPVALVAIDSATRPALVRSLAERIAAIGRLPLLGTVSSAPGGSAGVNSAARVRDVHARLALPAPVEAQLSTLDGPVLLIDDLVDSGWTMAMAARLLRRAGAPAVLPLALATTT